MNLLIPTLHVRVFLFFENSLQPISNRIAAETAVRHDVPLLIVVMNDSAYGSELQISREWELPDDLTVFPERDFAAIARGIGARSASARNLDQVRAALEGVDLLQGPYLIDCTINPDITARWLDDAFERG